MFDLNLKNRVFECLLNFPQNILCLCAFLENFMLGHEYVDVIHTFITTGYTLLLVMWIKDWSMLIR
jgi:hypothetical protein